MKKLFMFFSISFISLFIFSQPNAWINEFHYCDNGANEDNDFVEIVIESYTSYDLNDFLIELYNAETGKVYKSYNASSMMRMSFGNFSVFGWYTSLLDSNAAICLSYQGNVLNFISYNGYFIAKDGNAIGEMSKYLRISENESTPMNYSIQLAGTGLNYIAFDWQNPAANTSFDLNNNQTFAKGPWCYLSGGFNGWGADSLYLRKDLQNQNYIKTFFYSGTTQSQDFKFRSSSENWDYSWGRGDIVNTAEQTTFYNNGDNGSVTLTNGKYYTFIMKKTDEGNDTYGSVIETSEVPAKITSVSKPGIFVKENTQPTIHITFNKEPNDNTPNYEECVYLAYTTDNWQSTNNIGISVSNSFADVQIPSQLAGTVVQYYVFTFPWYNFDNFTDIDAGILEFDNNNGNFYTYTAVAPEIKETYQFVDNSALKLIYNMDMTGAIASDFVLNKNTDNITFSTISVNSDTIILSSPSLSISNNLLLDTIYDNTNNVNKTFYAGILSIDKTNTANSPDTILQNFNATFTGIVTATNDKDSIWFQENALPKHGVLVYGEDIATNLLVGDSAIFVGKKEITNYSTRLLSTDYKFIAGGKNIDTVFISANDINKTLLADDNTAEQYEGQLVFIPKLMSKELYSTEDSMTNCNNISIILNDGIDNHYSNIVGLGFNTFYDMTGIVTFNGQHYELNPRFTSDFDKLTFDYDFMDGTTQGTSENIENTVHQDSLSAFKIFEYQIVDDGIDTLPLHISEINILAASNNNSNFIRDLDGFYILKDGNLLDFASYRKIEANKITLYFDSNVFTVNNNSRADFEIYTWFTDTVKLGAVIQLKFNNTNYVVENAPCQSSFMRETGSDFFSNEFTVTQAQDIDEISKTVKIYPIPANNFVNFSENVENVELFGIMGQKMNVIFEDNSMNISKIAVGIYIARITTKDGEIVNKQIIKE